MDFLRERIEPYFDFVRKNLENEFINPNTNRVDYEAIQKEFIKRSQWFKIPGLARILLNHSDLELGRKNSDKIYLSNAAGMNKNAEISPQFLHYLGFDRVQIGTVTADAWDGNSRPNGESRIHLLKNGTGLNRLGLPGVGAKKIAQTLKSYGNHNIPIDINFMSTPNPNFTLDDKIKDIQKTLTELKYFGDNFIFNYFCPNTKDNSLNDLPKFLYAIREIIPYKILLIKIGPQNSKEQMIEMLKQGVQYKLFGFITINTNGNHKYEIFSNEPKGGLSGTKLYPRAKCVHEQFAKLNEEEFDSQFNLIGCGGIGNVETFTERAKIPNTIGIEMYTRLMFPKGFEELRKISKSRANL